ncbi:MAG: energy transducer TonB [Bacteroidales bacterium]|nr:energy transducer TonB [Bacteroidales bacterium]
MKKLVSLLFLLPTLCFAQEITPLKTFVEECKEGNYTLQARFSKVQDAEALLILIEDQGYLIPVKLDAASAPDLSAFEKGETIKVKGDLASLYIWGDGYKGLANAVVLQSKMDVPVQKVGDYTPDTFRTVEQMPTFKGGNIDTFAKWVHGKLKYPKKAAQNGISGRVLVGFTVKKNGKVADVKVLKGIDPDLDKEAVRVVSKSPKWAPGRAKGNPVDVSFSIPIVFKL